MGLGIPEVPKVPKTQERYVAILWFQIEATAKQFSNVTSVRFMPEELFQP